jgi:hypothetical protein
MAAQFTRMKALFPQKKLSAEEARSYSLSTSKNAIKRPKAE